MQINFQSKSYKDMSLFDLMDNKKICLRIMRIQFQKGNLERSLEYKKEIDKINIEIKNLTKLLN